MRITQVMVEFEKRVNDGNYGSEVGTAQYVAQVEDGEDPDDVIQQLLVRGRARVVGELKESETLTVRRALNPPKRMCSECGEPLGDDDGYLHPACEATVRDRRQQERAAQSAQYEAARAARITEPDAEDDDEGDDDEGDDDEGDDDEDDDEGLPL